MPKIYNIGLDIGTDSCGWAAADEEFNLLRLKGKTAYGSRIFLQAEDSKTRRAKRSYRRRINRRKYRINLLNGMFEKEICKVDDTFLLRLSESTYHLEDKSKHAQIKYPLFKEKELEKEFYIKYPTIYHLKEAQINNEKDAFKDVRYLYLTIHHIIKYRGNFLKEGNIDVKQFDASIIDDINDLVYRLYLDKYELNEEDVESFKILEKQKSNDLIDVLTTTKMNFTEKKKIILEKIITNPISDKFIKELVTKAIIPLILSGKANLKTILEENEQAEIVFDESFDAKIVDLQQKNNQLAQLVILCKSIFDFISVVTILGDHLTLSSAFIDVYNTHKEQLKKLKEITTFVDDKLKLTGTDRYYYKIFKESSKDLKSEHKINNYARLIKEDGDGSHATYLDFDKWLSNLFSSDKIFKDVAISNPLYDEILALADAQNFLKTISDVNTSVIPHQLNLHELNLILNNAKKYFPHLVGDDFIAKIKTLFKFRVPYFVGPLTRNEGNKYSNLVTKNKERITPFNFEQVVDYEQTKLKFISQRLNRCSYLLSEEVLPKNSILYLCYTNLDRLNKLVINGEQITQEVKLDIFNNLIQRQSKVTPKQIVKYLMSHYEHYKVNGCILSGINETDSFDNGAYMSLEKIFSKQTIENKEDVYEDIVKVMTIYKDAKMDGALSLKQKYDFITNSDVKKIAKLTFSGYGRLSKKLLVGIYGIDKNGELNHHRIMDKLYETTNNFQQIINDKDNNYIEVINSLNNEFVGRDSSKSKYEIAKDLIDEVPAVIRRSVYQALGIVKEIISITKEDPKNIVIEVTRNDEIKKKGKLVDSRVKELRNLLTSIIKDKKTAELYKKQSEEMLKDIKPDQEGIKGKHLYLYLKQMGLDFYTGKTIRLEDVFNGLYDLDHIVPKSLKPGDDSLDNLVLVNKEYNQKIKGDLYPLPLQIRGNKEVRALWKFALDKKLISESKFNKLTRDSDLTEDEIYSFVSRQINYVDYSNKILKDVFELLYPNTKVIFSKSIYPSYARKKLEIPKIRDLNDTHHAIDAYLNIVTGTILYDKFSDLRVIKAKEKHQKEANELKDPNNKENPSLNMKKYLSYRFKDIGDRIKTNCNRHDMLLSFRQNYSEDKLYKETLFKAGSGSLIAIHTKENSPLKDTNKYGGYSSLTSEYLVVAKNKKTNKRLLVAVPLMFRKQSKRNDELINKLKMQFGFDDDIEIDLKNIIYNNTKMIIDGCAYLINTANEKNIKLKLASPLFLPNLENKYLSEIYKIKEHISKDYKEDAFEWFTDKNKKQKITISKEKNLKTLLVLKEYSLQKRFDFYMRAQKLREYDINKFNELSLFEQIKEIEAQVFVFSRNNGWLLSKSSILDNDIIIQHDSFTGLYSTKVKL